eukprot:m.318938 g.318938  ORF g.318938 m.318938 type:complete len:1628 (+) comp27580_c0_seq1:447-5330(+)
MSTAVPEAMREARLVRTQQGGSPFGVIVAEMHARKAHHHEKANKDSDTTSWALHVFPYDSSIRRTCRKIVRSKIFDGIVLALIAANCLTLAIGRPYPGGDSDVQNDGLEIADRFFVVSFTVEMVIKVIALGFWWCGTTSYLRDGWNVLDFSIVMIGVLSWSLDNSSFAGARVLRAFRVFRPLRLVANVDSLKIEIEALTRSIPQMFNVALLFLFFLILYAIIGVEMYRHPMSNTCFDVTVDAWNRTVLAKVDGTACGSHQGHPCDEGQTCMSSTYPRTEGMQSFNNAGASMLTVFVCTTLEGWTEVMYLTDDSNGRGDLNWIYFITLIIFGAFLITNLVLGVISANFTKQGEAILSEKREKRRKLDKIEMAQLAGYAEWMDAGQIPVKMTLVETCRADEAGRAPQPLPAELRVFDAEFRDEFLELKRKSGWTSTAYVSIDAGLEVADVPEEVPEEDAVAEALPQILIKIPGLIRPLRIGVTMNDKVEKIQNRVQHHLPDSLKEASYTLQPDGRIANKNDRVGDLNLVFRLNDELDVIDLLDDNIRQALYKQSSLSINSYTATIAKSKRMTLTIMFLVFCNTVLLGMEHYPQDPSWTRIFFWGEIFFLTCFVAELSFKVVTFGFVDFWSSKFNKVDLIVTVASLLEFVLVQGLGTQPVGISVWRCVRLLRAFRYTSYWDGMNDLANAQLESLNSVLSLMLLLFIFIAIAALLGMQLFGGRFTFEDGKPRVNFDTFGSSMLAIFQVLTGEDWNVIMLNGIRAYGGIEASGWIPVLFFCFIVIVGNFTLLTVFLAIAMKALDDASGVAHKREVFHQEWDPKRPGLKKGSTAVDKPATTPLTLKFDPNAVTDHPELAGLEYDTCVPPENSVRRWISSIAFDMSRPGAPKTWPLFEGIVLSCIIASSACLAAEDPVNDDAQINKNLAVADYIFTAVFTVEMTIKIIALGLVFHPGAYFRDKWNILDGFVVIASLLTYALESNNSIKVLRTLRVIRPLRMIKRAKGLQHVVGCMIVTVYTIGNVFIITILLIFIFAVMGVQLFKGSFGSCNDGTIRYEAECVGTFLEYAVDQPGGVLSEREWSTAESNFDNLGSAMLTLFSASTTEGWVDVMFNGIDSTSPGEGPIEDNRPAMAAFFVLYITVLTFFMLNIFVGYVVMTFANEGEVLFQESGLQKMDRQCIDYVLEANPQKKYQPVYRVQDFFIKVAESKTVTTLIIIVILLNTLQLLMQFEGMSDSYAATLDLGNVIFLSFFIVECILKVLAYNPTVYFSDRWNVLDFVIVIAGVIDLGSGGGAANVGFLRLFRVARVLKIVAKGDDMRALLFTFMSSFKSLPYVGLLIMLIFFIYGVMGMAFFAKVTLDDDTAINRHNNFRDFGSSLLVLFRCSTGESWQQIMYACWYGEGGSTAAIPYFVSFTVLSTFLFLNLFVAVIMDNFEYLTNDQSELGPQQLAGFVQAWSQYDPAGTRSIDYTELPNMLREMDPPLGLGNKCSDQQISMNLLRMNTPIAKDGTVDFNATMLSIIRFRRGIRNDSAAGWEIENARLKQTIVQFWPRVDPIILDRILPDPHPHNATVGLLHAVYLMQNMYRMIQEPSEHGTRHDLKAGPGGKNKVVLENPQLVARKFSSSRVTSSQA